MNSFYRNLLFILTLITLFFFTLKNYSYASTILLDESFDDGNANDGTPTDWDEFVGTNSYWTVDGDNRYIGSVHKSGSSQGRSLGGDLSWTDYIYELDIQGLSGVDHRIFFRVNSDATQGYGLKYRENNFGLDGHMALVKMTPGLPNLALAWDYDFLSHIGDMHHLEVVAFGNNIKVFADNVLRIDYTDTNNPHLSGKVGFFLERAGFSHPDFDGFTTTAFDNVKVSLFPDTPIGPFELPFEYDGRGEGDAEKFETAFNARFTSLFDHNPKPSEFVNFESDEYKPSECNTTKEACYDSHNGVDFDDTTDDKIALSVAEGVVVYRSEDKSEEDKKKEKIKCNYKDGFGCMVVVDYSTNDHEGLYGLFGHFTSVEATEGAKLTEDSIIGEIGTTGNSSGTHLHFSAMQLIQPIGLSALKTMQRSDWQALTSQLSANKSLNVTKGKKSTCTYTAPNGLKFAMIDPNGWNSEVTDPWSLSAEDGGCEIESPYLWKYQANLPEE